MAASNILTLTQENFQSEALNNPGPILVDFWAEWCGPCKMLAPILDEIAQEYDGKVRVGKVDIDQHQALAAQFGVTAIPTLLVFKNGQVVEQMRGLRSKRDLKTALDRAATA